MKQKAVMIQDVLKDFELSLKLYEQAASEGSSKALYNLAILYENGKGVKQDLEKAVSYYLKAAEKDVNINHK
jgi:uncharacterized protein